MGSWLWVGLLACRGDAEDTAAPPTDPDPDPPGVTTDPDRADVTAATCVLDGDNALRATCTVDLDAPDDVVVTLETAGVDPLEFRSAGPAARQVVEVWGLVPGADFQWVAAPAGNPASSRAGSLRAGDLPGTLAGLEVNVDVAGPHGDEAVVLNYGCEAPEEAVVVVDRAGRVRWYQEVDAVTSSPPGPQSVRGLNVTPEGTILAVLDRTWIAEFALDGTQRLALRAGTDFAQPVHHDASRWGDLTYAVFAESVDGPDGPTVTDGFYVFDGAGAQVAEWHMADHFVPEKGGAAGGGYWGDLYPGALDWSHSNAITIDEAGGVTLSLRYQAALVHVVGDPASPDFGAVEWVLVGNPEQSVLTSTVAATSSTGIGDLGFEGQHHVSALGGGRLTLWDNGNVKEEGSRVVELAVAGGTADFVREWPVDAFCPGQGSGSLLANGNVLVDCAPVDTIAEVDPTGTTVWSARISCFPGFMVRPLYRGLPIALFPEGGPDALP